MVKRGRCNQKKASVKLSGWVIVEILFIIMIAMFVFSFVNTVKESHIFRMSYLTKDMALLTDTVQAVPGDISYSYGQQNFNFSDYKYVFSNTDVKIYQNDDNYTYQSYPFYDDQGIVNMYTTEFIKPKSIKYEKKGDVLFISDGSSINPSISTCVSLTNKEKFSTGFVASYYFDNIGKSIADSFTAVSNSFPAKKYDNNLFNVGQTQSTVTAGIKAFFTIGELDSPTNEFPVQIRCLDSTEECVVFACILKNKMTLKQDAGFTSVEIVSGGIVNTISGVAKDNIKAAFNPSLVVLVGKHKAKQHSDKIASSINEAIIEYDKKASQTR